MKACAEVEGCTQHGKNIECLDYIRQEHEAHALFTVHAVSSAVVISAWHVVDTQTKKHGSRRGCRKTAYLVR